ncbi:hypothetical protein ES703_26374 [subsurface metagenome]
MDLKKGDVLLWWDDEWTFQVGKRVWRLPIPTPIAVHTDVYVGNGKVRTCIQGKGTSGSTVSKRQKQFLKGVAVRVTEPCNMDRVVKLANEWKSDYDWMGYYGQYLDVFVSQYTFPFPDFSSKSDAWTEKLQNPKLAYCSSHAAICYWWGSKVHLVGKDPHLVSPQDIYVWAQKHKKTRKIIKID